MNFKHSIFLLLFLVVPHCVVSQEKWSLAKCIEYASNNNLTLQRKQVDLLIADIQKNQAKLNVLPSLNLGGTHGFNWGQSIDPFTNQFATDRIRTNNLYAGSTWNIFSGLKNYYIHQQSNLTNKATEQEIEVAIRNLKIDITAAYMQVVLDHYLIEAALNQVFYAIETKKIIQERFDLGYATKYDLLSIEGQLSLDSAVLTQAENNKEYSLLLLRQLLNSDEVITIDIPSIEKLDTLTIKMDSSLLIKNPELELIKTQKDIQTFQVKIAKAQLLPTASINSSIGSGYSGSNMEFVGSEFLPKPFEVQLQENFYQSSVLTVNIPVFNNGRVRNEIKIAEAELIKTSIDQKIILQKLKNQLEQLENEIKNEKANILGLKRALNASNQSYKAATEQFEIGALNIQNYLEQRKDLFKIQSDFYISFVTLKFKEEMYTFLY